MYIIVVIYNVFIMYFVSGQRFLRTGWGLYKLLVTKFHTSDDFQVCSIFCENLMFFLLKAVGNYTAVFLMCSAGPFSPWVRPRYCSRLVGQKCLPVPFCNSWPLMSCAVGCFSVNIWSGRDVKSARQIMLLELFPVVVLCIFWMENTS